MRNNIILILTILFCVVGISVNANAQDCSSKTATFVRDILGGDQFEQEILKDHPEGKLEWKEKLVESDEEKFTYLVYSEFTQPGKEPLYHFYEVKVRYVPPSEIAQALPKNNN